MGESLTFGQVLSRLSKDSKLRFARDGWNGMGMYISRQNPDRHSANNLPYLYFFTVDSQRVPWVASHTDMLVHDWKEVP